MKVRKHWRSMQHFFQLISVFEGRNNDNWSLLGISNTLNRFVSEQVCLLIWCWIWRLRFLVCFLWQWCKLEMIIQSILEISDLRERATRPSNHVWSHGHKRCLPFFCSLRKRSSFWLFSPFTSQPTGSFVVWTVTNRIQCDFCETDLNHLSGGIFHWDRLCLCPNSSKHIDRFWLAVTSLYAMQDSMSQTEERPSRCRTVT